MRRAPTVILRHAPTYGEFICVRGFRLCSRLSYVSIYLT